MKRVGLFEGITPVRISGGTQTNSNVSVSSGMNQLHVFVGTISGIMGGTETNCPGTVNCAMKHLHVAGRYYLSNDQRDTDKLQRISTLLDEAVTHI